MHSLWVQLTAQLSHPDPILPRRRWTAPHTDRLLGRTTRAPELSPLPVVVPPDRVLDPNRTAIHALGGARMRLLVCAGVSARM